ncbi:MAG: amino acid adenylation domain-containing protein, partial [Vulcanimicrobiaceae bacterium]
MKGTLDSTALSRALNRIIERHEVLRTTFTSESGEPSQFVSDRFDLALVKHDFRAFPDSSVQLERFIAGEIGKSFDLQRGPLIRASLVQLALNDHALVLIMHHIVSDGWSMSIFTRELNSLYSTFVRGESDCMSPLQIQYSDYAHWQRRWLSDDTLNAQKMFWSDVLTGAPTLLSLPVDRPRPPVADYMGASVSIVIEQELCEKLRALSKRAGTTLFVTILSAWGALLARLSGQQEVVIGTPVANRSHADLEDIIGFFVNTIALRLDYSPNFTIAEMLAETKARAVAAQEHQDLPFERVVEIVNPPRSMSHAPIFQAMFVWQNIDHTALQLEGLTAMRVVNSSTVAKYDVTLSLGEVGDHISGALEYATALFDQETAQRHAASLLTMLSSMVLDDERPVAALPSLSPGELELVLDRWNDTACAFPERMCLHELFEKVVASKPDALAIHFDNEQVTYAELNVRANRLARHLRENGVVPNDRVAVCFDRGMEMIVAILAVLKSGAGYVPLDPNYPEQRLRYVLLDCGAQLVLTHGRIGKPLYDLLALSGSRIIDLDTDREWWMQLPGDDLPRRDLAPNHLAYIIYTSGSTGEPKGVMIEHRSAVASTYARLKTYGSYTRFLLLSSIAFDSSVAGIFGTLCSGGLLSIPQQADVTDPHALRAMVSQLRITSILCVPSLLQLLLEEPFEGQIEQIIVAGEVCLPRLVERATEAFPHAIFYNEYGPTEATVWASVHHCSSPTINIPIGRPIPNVRIYLLDERLAPVHIGAVGEIYIGGATVARGYLNREELTLHRFIASPFVEGDRLYRTGDLALFKADGTIEFVGRSDFQVKIRGFRVELGEIEAKLSLHTGVRDVIVVFRDESQEEKRLIAYYTLEAANNVVTAQSLRTHLSATLPDHMIPSAYVQLDTLPLTSNGKVDRECLPEPSGEAVVQQLYEEPSGEVEVIIAGVYCDLLRLERVGRHDDFFELGGHSLLAVRAIARLRERLGVEITIADFFANSRLLALAEFVASAGISSLPHITRADRAETLPLSFAQQRLWFLACMADSSQVYHIPAGIRLHGDVNGGILSRALDAIVARHEVFRTTFVTVDGEPWQHIAPMSEGFGMRIVDLRESVDPNSDLERLIARVSHDPFNLTTGPLARATLVQLGALEYVLLLAIHHIISDGWSMGVFVRELCTFYRSFVLGEVDPLEPLEVQYADYAVWQRHWLRGELLNDHVRYWKNALGGVPSLLPLPTDRPRPLRQDFCGAAIPLEFDATLTARLKALNLRHGMTLFTVLLAAWGALLARLSGEEDIVVGVPTGNRKSAQTETLIGFFVNTLAIRLDFSGNPTVEELLVRTKSSVLGAQEHQDLPFEHVVELLNLPRSLAHSPLFNTMFVWQNTEHSKFSLPGIDASAMHLEHPFAQYDLTLNLRESEDGLSGSLEYATALFDAATIERFSLVLQFILEAMVLDVEQPIMSVPIISAEDRQKLLVEWHGTLVVGQPDMCIHEMFEEQVERTPNATAVRFEDSVITYAQLNARANRLAHHLRLLGLRPETRIALFSERSIEMVVGLLAIFKAGGTFVPLDPLLPSGRIAYILQDASPLAVLTHSTGKSALCENATELGIAVLDMVDDAQNWVNQSESNLPRCGLESGHLAYVIYTSGSTGAPKGVMVEHRSLCSQMAALQDYAELTPVDIVLQSIPYNFDASLWELLLPLVHCAAL